MQTVLTDMLQETQAAVDSAAEQLKLHQQQKHQLQQKPETGPAIDLSSVPADQLQMTLQQLLLALAGELHLGLQLAQQSYWQQRATGVGYTAAAGDMEVTEAAVEVYLTELLKQVRQDSRPQTGNTVVLHCICDFSAHGRCHHSLVTLQQQLAN